MADDDDRGRDESGRFSTTKTDEDYLDVLRSEGRMTAKEFSEKCEIPKRSVLYRLKDLEERGRVESEQFSQTKVWSVADSDSDSDSETDE